MLNEMTRCNSLGDAYARAMTQMKEQKESRFRLGIEALMRISNSERPLHTSELSSSGAILAGVLPWGYRSDFMLASFSSEFFSRFCTAGLLGESEVEVSYSLLRGVESQLSRDYGIRRKIENFFVI